MPPRPARVQLPRWLSKAGDARPTLSFEFQRRISAKTLVLIQADTSPSERGRHARVKRVAITVNDARKPFEAELAPDPARPTRISFPKRMRLRRLSIRVLDFEPGSEFEQEVGFAEVGLLD